MGLALMSRDALGRRRKGPPVIGARDDSIAGDPCCRSVHLRRRSVHPSPRPGRQDHGCRADRLGGSAGGDGSPFGSAVPWPGGQALARLVPASALPVEVQPQVAPACAFDRERAAAGLRAPRLGRSADRRRHSSGGRQLPPAARAAASSRAPLPTATARQRGSTCGACAWSC